MGTALTSSPADILKYQNDLVRTGQFQPLGRMKQIAIAPSADWQPKPGDPFMSKFGRLIDFRNQALPIAQSLDHSMILVTATLKDSTGRVALPDVPLPGWKPPDFTKDQIEGVEKTDEHGKKFRDFEPLGASRQAPTIPQSLRDRADGKLDGTNILIFSPVVNVTFQPEIDRKLAGMAWILQWDYNPADHTHPTLMVDEATGETHFYGGRFQILMSGEE